MKKENKLLKILKGAGEYAFSISIFILVWHFYVKWNDVPEYILPSPDKVWVSFVDLFRTGTVWPHLWATTYEVVLGFIIGSLIGMALGYLFTKVEPVKTALMPYLIFPEFYS